MISEVKKVNLRDGETLHVDIVENGSPVWLVVTHGLGEHGERHHYMYDLFSQYFNICIYDLRGHGKSSGKRTYVENFKDFTSDLGEVLDYLKDNYSMNRYVLFGHSMGGLITASFMQNDVSKNLYPEKVFLSGPAVAGPGLLGKGFKLAPMKLMYGLKSLPASLPLEGLLDLSKLSHDPRVYESYITDPMNTLKVHTKLFLEILTEAREVFSRPLRINCDLFCAVGTNDGLVDPDSVIEYFTHVEKNAKLFKVDGGYHELHNEIQKYKTPYIEFLKESIMDSLFE
ncbi:MAG: alpha-beta hydrolase superfamily lysophospholipase [Bacteriovoracaceae bacterium]|jgi:acylglycerol lipase